MPQMESQSCFNTSHVTLYLLQTTQILHMEEVSIHHMLLFITFREHTLHGCSFVSIHHMLLFICSRQDSGENVPGFQYITCYSLSIELADKVLPKNRFNTSHVTLYRLQIRRPGNRKHVSIHHMLLFIMNERYSPTLENLFQYITCYSLSKW